MPHGRHVAPLVLRRSQKCEIECLYERSVYLYGCGYLGNSCEVTGVLSWLASASSARWSAVKRCVYMFRVVLLGGWSLHHLFTLLRAITCRAWLLGLRLKATRPCLYTCSRRMLQVVIAACRIVKHSFAQPYAVVSIWDFIINERGTDLALQCVCKGCRSWVRSAMALLASYW